jgi:hypothetical protein
MACGARNKNFNAEIKTDFDERVRKINVVPQDIGRVLLNLFNNAFYAIRSKSSKLTGSTSSIANKQYVPKSLLSQKN